MPKKPRRRSTRLEHGEVKLNLFDPRHGDQAFKLERFRDSASLLQPQRSNCFTILWVQDGAGGLHADLVEHSFRGPAILFLNPYQTFFLSPQQPVSGARLQFHANFFCIETYHEAVGCNGVLFNNVYGRPKISLDEVAAAEFEQVITQMEKEFSTGGLAHAEAIVSLLKFFLIKATRVKLEQQQLALHPAGTAKPAVLERLAELIEKHFRTRHGPAEYAAELHMTPKALGKLVKAHFGQTTTELIRERVLKHAKWQLLHTRKPVKEVASEAGFQDELYFSRLFKKATGYAPTAFREFETSIRGGSNLSM